MHDEDRDTGLKEFKAQYIKTVESLYAFIDNCEILMELAGKDRDARMQWINERIDWYDEDLKAYIMDISDDRGYANYKRAKSFMKLMLASPIWEAVKMHKRMGR